MMSELSVLAQQKERAMIIYQSNISRILFILHKYLWYCINTDSQTRLNHESFLPHLHVKMEEKQRREKWTTNLRMFIITHITNVLS